MSLAGPSTDLRQLIDDFFAERFATDNPIITEAVRRMLAAGGKRLRPRLTLLAAQAVGADDPAEHVALASYIELIHVATLIHDDVVDGATRRRGVNATAVDFGNQISVLAGDYLLAWVFKNVTASYDAPIPHVLSATLAEICDGEVLQLRSLGDADLDPAGYEEIVAKKTASLFTAATRCGAIVGGGSPEQVERLASLGVKLGVAYQIADDVLDLTATQDVAGKPVGHDLIEGKVTLPLILALRRGEPGARARVERFFAGDRTRPQDVLELIAATDGIAAARRRAAALFDEAEGELAAIAPGRRAPLKAMVDALRATAT